MDSFIIIILYFHKIFKTIIAQIFNLYKNKVTKINLIIYWKLYIGYIVNLF